MLVLFIALSALLVGSSVYCVLILVATASYLRQPRRLGGGVPISVLKPLMGADEGLEENLRSFFTQQYSGFEILGAVRHRHDAAVPVFEKLQSAYPGVRARLLITGEPPYANAKVFSLSCMFAAARHDLLVMSDSDIRVEPDMLASVAAEFADARVGLATCPYRAVAGRSPWSKLEAVGMNTEFLGGLLVARLLMGVDFAVGPTIVARRSVLEFLRFDRLKDYLAEDFVMGNLAAAAGLGVILSRTIVEHRIGSQPWRGNASHRLRWARSTRRSRPGGYMGQLFTNPLPLALGLWLVQPGWWVLWVLVLRGLAAWVTAALVLRGRVNWVLLPVQDFLSFGFWVAGFFGNTILWRGKRYYLHPDGRFELRPGS